MKRRSFLKTAGGTAAGTAIGVQPLVDGQTSAQAEPRKADELPQRTLGRTDMKVSVIGFPGLAVARHEQKECNKIVHDAFRRGVNCFDVAPAYGNGAAEIKLGIGLQGIDRSRYYLACKTKMRDKAGAREELERSLRRLKTDYFDIYQLHVLKRPEEVDEALGPDGAIQTMLKAKEEGKVRYLGFSAHTSKAALKAMKQFRFDTVMFPINFVEYFTLGFGKAVLQLAEKQGVGVLAIKQMSRGAWPQGVERTRQWWYRTVEDRKEIDLAVRFTLSRPGVAVGFTPAFADLLDKAIKAGCSYRPPSEAELKQLEKLAGTCESLFRRHQQAVAHGAPPCGPIHPDSPDDGCPV